MIYNFRQHLKFKCFCKQILNKCSRFILITVRNEKPINAERKKNQHLLRKKP